MAGFSRGFQAVERHGAAEQGMGLSSMMSVSAGIGLAVLLPVHAGVTGQWVIAGGGVLLLLLPAARAVRRFRLLRRGLEVLVGLLAGVTIALWHGHQHHARLLPAVWEGGDVWVRGHVDSLPELQGRRLQFAFHIEWVCTELLPRDCPERSAGFSPRRIMLSSYDEAIQPDPGEQWLLRVRLHRPTGSVNPGLTGAAARWFRQGISAVGSVRYTARNQRIEIRALDVNRWRHALLQRLQLPDGLRHQAGPLAALTAGDRRPLSPELWDLFAATGTSHLMVISGLHISLVAWLAYTLGATLVRRLAWPCRWMPAAWWAASAALAAATVYAAMAGFSLSTRRALLMLAVYLTGRLSGRQFPRAAGLSCALLVVLALDPLAVTSGGFWFSFMAVAVLVLVLSPGVGMRHRGRRIRATEAWERWGRAQWSVSLGLALPLLVWQGGMPLLSPIANLVAIPLVSLWVVPMALVGACLSLFSPDLGQWPLAAAALGLDVLLTGLEWLRDRFGQPGIWTPVLPPPAGLVCAAAGILLLLLPRGTAMRHLAAWMLLPLLWPRPEMIRPGRVQVLVADVGQGAGVVLQTRKHTVVFDTGPGPYRMSRLLRSLRHRAGHQRIALLIVSHWDSDHRRGAVAILEEHPVHQALTSAGQGGAVFSPCVRGQSWHLDGVWFRMLAPSGERPVDAPRNDASCVLLVEAGPHRLLLPGDIEMAGERELLSRYAEEEGLRADIVLMPHHGSATSSGIDFVTAVSPRVAIYSASMGNRFGHPDPAVVRRYHAAGARVLGTSRSGAIGFCLGTGCGDHDLVRHGVDRPRYWRAPPLLPDSPANVVQ